MPTLMFQPADASGPIAVQSDEGATIMAVAVRNGIDGIEAECGGTCSCATCHVYVDERFLAAIPPPAADEEAMLDFVAAERRPNSRLSCQIRVSAQLDGVVLRLPDRQVE